MSADLSSKDKGRLLADAGLGVLIRVTDGLGRDFGSAVARLDLPVPEGLYAVEFSTSDRTAEAVVRVVAGRETVAQAPWASERASPVDPIDAFNVMAIGLAKSPGAEFLASGHIGSTRSIDRSSLVLEVVDADGAPTHDIVDEISVIDGNGNDVPSVSPNAFVGGDAVKAWAEVTPGRYRLRFRALSGETLDQVVPVLKDRTTIVRLQAATATVMVHGSEGFTNIRNRGVDATRTVVVTSVPRDAREGFDEILRLAQMLLRDLANGRSPLSKEFLQRLDEPGTDPLLRVYAALVITNCLEVGASPALDEKWSEDPRQLSSITRRWCKRAIGLLGDAHRAGMPPDAIAARWQIERLLGPDDSKTSRKTAASIRMPPMLECAWRWAIARSTIDRNALQDFASIRAAAKTAGGTAPWLCWNGAGAKGLENPAPAASDDELEALVRSVASKAKTLRERQERYQSNLVSPHSVPAEVAATALRAEQVLAMPGRTDGRSDGPVAALAVALSLPLAALAGRLRTSEEALDRALAEEERGDAPRPEGRRSDAPGWSRKVKFKGDPNRGRFGGLSERDGFRLEATFAKSGSKNWATIHLAIIGPPGFDGEAVMYLHDSFRPPRYRYRFKDGEVRDKLTAWGGFTVGAWIPAHRIELELNLAEVDGAPLIIRER